MYDMQNVENIYSRRQPASNYSVPSYNAGGGVSSSSYASSSTFDKEKYKNAKGIGSDMLNEAELAADPSERLAAKSRISHFSGSTAISSDAVRVLQQK